MLPPSGPKRKVYLNVLVHVVLWFVLPAAVYLGLHAFAAPEPGWEKRLEQSPEVQRNRANREKLISILKPDLAKDKEFRDRISGVSGRAEGSGSESGGGG